MQAILDKEWKAGAKAGAAKTTEAGKTEIVDLGKGRTLVLIPDKTLPYVSANLTYSGGDALLKPSEQGLSSLAANVLTKSTAKRERTEVQAFPFRPAPPGWPPPRAERPSASASPPPRASTRNSSDCSVKWSNPRPSARTKPPGASRIDRGN